MQKPRPASAFDPKPQDGDFCVGDLHADLSGFQKLLKKAHWNPDKQRIFLLGDLLDRGHQAKKLLDFKKQYGIFSILGNHDFFHFRYAIHLQNKILTGKKIPMHLTPEKKDTFVQFGEDQTYIEYMLPIIDDYPAYLPFEDSQGKGYLMHGGPDCYNPIEDQDLEKMLIRRYHPSPNHFIEEETQEYQFWQKSYTGHLGVIINGHHPVPAWNYHENTLTISLDGNGVAGKYAKWGQGMHRLMIFGSREIIESPGSKKAEANYKKVKGL